MITPRIRNTNIELLRFILMCFIFFWHILVHGYDLKMLGADNYEFHGNFVLAAFGLTLFVPATYCFVFISGYYGIKFKIKRLITLLLWCSIVSVGAQCYRNTILGEPFQLMAFLESVLPITSNKWWFMTDFIMLYILSPILNEGFDRLQDRGKLMVLVLLLVFSFAGVGLLYQNQGSSLEGLIFIYLLARYIRISKWGGKLTLAKAARIYCLSFALLFIMILTIFYVAQISHKVSLAKLIFPILGYANPLIVSMAVSIFYMILRLPERGNRYVNKILSANLFIYLITEIGVFVSYRQIALEFESSTMVALFRSLSIIIACMLIGHVIMYVVSLLINIGEKFFKITYNNFVENKNV